MKDRILIFPIEEVHGGDAVAVAFGRFLPDLDDALGIRVWERLEHDAVYETEHGGAGSDAEGQSEDGDGGKAGTFTDHAQAKADVVPQFVHTCSHQTTWKGNG